MEDLNGTRSSFSTGWYHATMWRTSVAQPWIRAMLRWAQCSYSLTRSAPCHFKPLWRCLPWQLQNNQHVSYLKKKKIIIAKNEATINQSVQKCWYSKLMPIFFFFFRDPESCQVEKEHARNELRMHWRGLMRFLWAQMQQRPSRGFITNKYST